MQNGNGTRFPPSTFVRYGLPIPIGPPRRVPNTAATSSENNSGSNTSRTGANFRTALDIPVPIPSPLNSPPSPPPVTQTTWQQLRQRRQQQQQQYSMSPILPVEPTPLPPAPGPLVTATRLMMDLLDTPRLNDSLVYYTQIINRDVAQEGRRGLSYDVIQQQTKIIPYCTITRPLNDTCPISQVQFELIDSVMQINICKHNFNPYSLLRWFDDHSTCPMCRQQINVNIEHDDNGSDDDDQTIHMYNNGREEEPYRSQDQSRNYESRYDDSDFSSVG
jgi:hypothetical protein